MGFPVPVGKWFREQYKWLIDEYVLSSRTLDRQIFNREAVEHLVSDHQTGKRNNADRLWSLMTFEMWLRQFIDGEAVSSSLSDVEVVQVA
jgi:asparagine synthase (glutamine-hydrolysing)